MNPTYKPTLWKRFKSLRHLPSSIQHKVTLQYSKIRGYFSPNSYEVYADGSYRPGIGGGYGVVIIQSGVIIHQIAGHLPGVQDSQQTAAEFQAVRAGIKWCEAQGARNVHVYYDCMGVKHFADKLTIKQSRKQPDLYSSYHIFMRPRVIGSGNCKVTLHKVKAHSSNILNTRADRLAKIGLYQIKPEWLEKAWAHNSWRGLPRQTAMHIQRVAPYVISAPLELNYA